MVKTINSSNRKTQILQMIFQFGTGYFFENFFQFGTGYFFEIFFNLGPGPKLKKSDYVKIENKFNIKNVEEKS